MHLALFLLCYSLVQEEEEKDNMSWIIDHAPILVHRVLNSENSLGSVEYGTSTQVPVVHCPQTLGTFEDKGSKNLQLYILDKTKPHGDEQIWKRIFLLLFFVLMVYLFLINYFLFYFLWFLMFFLSPFLFLWCRIFARVPLPFPSPFHV
jgi:hypothetical protein